MTSNWARLAALALSVASVVASSFNSSECRVKAWVRAEDLSPGATSNGDLRVKVLPSECGTQIASVSLRLQLDEFGEVKYLRPGVVLPKITKADNQTRLESLALWDFGTQEDEIIYNYTAYDKALTDPAYWVVKAEERRGWVTETVLFGSNMRGMDFSEPQVVPFVVVSPLVNYPPAQQEFNGWSGFGLDRRLSRTALAYRYHAIVTFSDGRKEELPVGYTNFRPRFMPPPPSPQAFTWDARFEERDRTDDNPPAPHEIKTEKCLPLASRSVFTAHVELEDGDVFRVGQALRGRITINSTSGSTTMSRVSVKVQATFKDHWSIDQATVGGDSEFIQPQKWARDVVSTDIYPGLFSESNTDGIVLPEIHDGVHSALSDEKPSFDFAMDIPDSLYPQFSSYYRSSSAELQLSLTVHYSKQVERCIQGKNIWDSDYFDDEEEARAGVNAGDAEDGLWDTTTPVGEPRHWLPYGRSLFLTARVPIVVIGEASSGYPRHYLDRGTASPTILPASAQIHFPLPPAQPAIIEEPLVNTTARMLLPTMERSRQRDILSKEYREWSGKRWRAPNPTTLYSQGGYVGVLWKKKKLAMERGLLQPVQVEQEGEQRPFSV